MPTSDAPKHVKHLRQILLWPIQLIALDEKLPV